MLLPEIRSAEAADESNGLHYAYVFQSAYRIYQLLPGLSLVDNLQDFAASRFRTEIDHRHSVFLEGFQLLRRFAQYIGGSSVESDSLTFREVISDIVQYHKKFACGQA